MPSLVVSTEPTSEPVTYAEAKAHLRLDDDVDQTMVEGMIVAARRTAEQYTGRKFITQTLKLRLDGFPCDGPILLPAVPVASVSTIEYVDGDGVTQTWSSAEYRVDIYASPARVTPEYGYVWPYTRWVTNSVIVTFVAGAASAPGEAKAAIKLLTAALYEHREDFVVGTIATDLPLCAQRLLSPLRVPSALVAA